MDIFLYHNFHNKLYGLNLDLLLVFWSLFCWSLVCMGYSWITFGDLWSDVWKILSFNIKVYSMYHYGIKLALKKVCWDITGLRVPWSNWYQIVPISYKYLSAWTINWHNTNQKVCTLFTIKQKLLKLQRLWVYVGKMRILAFQCT